MVSSDQVFAAPFIAARNNAQALARLVALLGGTPLSDVELKEVAAAPARVTTCARSTSPVGDITAVPGEHLVAPAVDELSAVLDEYLTADLNPWSRTEDFLDVTRSAFFAMPSELRTALTTFKSRSNDYGALLIRNLPVGNVPRTPSETDAHPDKTFESEFWLAMTACALGEPFAYAQEKRGSLYQNVVPTRKNAEKLSSESSTILLDYHTEAAFHPFKPDYVLLLCLRQDHDAKARTSNAGIRMVMQHLSLQDRWELRQQQFRTGVDFSFGSRNMEQGNGPLLAVLNGNPYDPELCYDLDLMVAETDAGNRALQALRKAVGEVGSYVALTAGDLLVVDNRQAVHARSEFTPRYDGWDRWLQRMCVTNDLGASGAWREAGSRVIDVQFNV
ncbi:L-asparagine oxygenase [Saccharothrix isguenensis]